MKIFFTLIATLFVFIKTRASPLLSDIDNSTLCRDFFENLTSSNYQGPNISLEVNNFLLYSGHSLNDLGFYKQCNELPTQKYSILMVDVGLIGFCGPSFCSVSQLQNYTETIVKAISILTKRDLSTLAVGFLDPDQTGIEQGFWLYFTIFIYTVIVGLVIAGTILANFIKRPKSSQYPLSINDSTPQDVLLNKESCNDDVVFRDLNCTNTQGPTPVQELPQRKTLLIRVLECFDIVSNFQALFKNEEVPGQDQNLNIFNGIRALAFGWVVYGHMFSETSNSKNFLFAELFMKSGWALILISAFYAVDTFFYLSGFFTGFLLISKLKKMKLGLKSYGMILFHRWIRLWPAYFVAILFFWKIVVNLGSGPLWWSNVEFMQICSDSAWKNLLFIDNAFNEGFTTTYCFNWGWYLSCDFQMFLIAPFICWLYIKNRSRSKTIIYILIVISIIYGYIESSNSNYTFFLMPGSSLTNDYLMKYYVNTLVRMSPYLEGVLIGFMFKEYKDGENNFFSWIKGSTIKSLICSATGFALIIFIIFFPRTLQVGMIWSAGFATTWNILSRPFWVLGIFLLTAPCLVGKLNALSSFLRNFYFTLIARLSYATYLIHLIFILIFVDGGNQIYGSSESYEAGMAFAFMMISCPAAMILHLFVEKPFTNIETRILSAKKSRLQKE